MEKENWYILQTEKGREYDSARLLDRAIPASLCGLWSIPKKIKPFRHGGVYYAAEEIMFPGYVFVCTGYPGKLHKELQKSREFPQFTVFGKNELGEDELVPISAPDLLFLQKVCGAKLQLPMGLTDVTLGEDRRILKARGVLEQYMGQIVKLNLHKRVAVTRVYLFNRSQEIFFGIRLEQDRYCAG